MFLIKNFVYKSVIEFKMFLIIKVSFKKKILTKKTFIVKNISNL